MTPESKILDAANLRIGLSAQFERKISEDDVLAFARTSEDYNPLHIDPIYAAQTNYGQRIVHGAFQVGLASAMLGMHLPGRNALLTLINAQFPAPLCFPSDVKVVGEIVAWNPITHGGVLRVTVLDISTGVITADIRLGFSLHEEVKRRDPQHSVVPNRTRTDDRPIVLVTGASGGIGSEVARTLLKNYRVLALHNRTPLPDDLIANTNLQSVSASFAEAGWSDVLSGILGTEPLYGIIHCAWSGMPRGGLLNLPTETIQSQLSYGTTHLIELAKLIAAHVPPAGGRLIALGSVAGSLKPVLSLAAYSLAKAAMEHTVRLLAAELAGKKITVNAICPSFVPVGMNKQADERRQKMEAAQVPLGRLCQPGDISGLADWLLSPDAAFISGQVFGLTGGQL